MSLVRDDIMKLVKKGKLDSEVTLHGITFLFETLTGEDELMVDGLVDIDSLKEKYNTEGKLNTYPDMIGKSRSITRVAFAIKEVNGKPTVDKDATDKERFKQIMDFRDDLFELSAGMLDRLINEYRLLAEKQKELFDNFEEVSGKS